MMNAVKNFSPQQSRANFDQLSRVVSARAFTLIELMISIALVVILILGVSQVFQYTTQAVGSGEAITDAIRNSRSAQTAFGADFNAMVGYGPGSNDSASLIISSRAAYAYRDAKDQASQGTIDSSAPTAQLPNAAFRDIDGDGVCGKVGVNGEIIYPDTYNYRNHRLDTLSFFARSQFARQTGNPGSFAAAMTSPEAWIWYGHLWLPDNSGSYFVGGNVTQPTFPCAYNGSTNPNNCFGSKLTLGRMAILLAEKNTANQIDDLAGNHQWFIDRLALPTDPDLTPLYYQSGLNTAGAPTTTNDPPFSPATNTTSYFYNSRCDLACTSIANYRQKLSGWITAHAYNRTLGATWWWPSLSDGSISRFQCNPFLSKPMTAGNMAQASPYMMGGCSQFIVEYAGDFLTQDNNQQDTTRVPTVHAQWGDIIGAANTDPTNNTNVKSDGQLDYFINTDGVKQTIWYGLPRNTSGRTTTCAGNGYNPNPNGDVVPLRDWLEYVYDDKGNLVSTHNDPPASFERNYTYPSLAELADYNANMTVAQAQNGYTCAWGPNDAHPKIMLIRITMTLEDPTGRLPEGQTFQYVFPVTPSPSTN